MAAGFWYGWGCPYHGSLLPVRLQSMPTDPEVCDWKLQIPSKQRSTVQHGLHLLTFCSSGWRVCLAPTTIKLGVCPDKVDLTEQSGQRRNLVVICCPCCHTLCSRRTQRRLLSILDTHRTVAMMDSFRQRESMVVDILISLF